MNAWLSVTFLVGKDHAETLSDWLMLHANALFVSTADADAGTAFEIPQFDEPDSVKNLWVNNHITAFFEPNIDMVDLNHQIRKTFGSIETIRLGSIDDQDWVRKTQSQFSPICISDRLWIVPSWHDAPNKEAINIEMDPGMAFGTGSHPTTHLCLQWLDMHIQNGQKILDYGCGSGILAIAAAKLGGTEIIGIDIDPQAVESAKKNADKNSINATFLLTEQSAHIPKQYFDVLIANILTNPLKMLASVLPTYLKINGTLILSGILSEQAEDIINAYQPYISLRIDNQSDGWVRLTGQKIKSVVN